MSHKTLSTISCSKVKKSEDGKYFVFKGHNVKNLTFT